MLFQSTLVGRGRGEGWLQAARIRLVVWLAERMDGVLRKQTTIVFDAHRFRRNRQEAEREQLEALGEGIRVAFANDYEEADDLLELLIRQHSHPKGLLVVSSDHRIQKRAQARKCKHQDSEDFWDEWESKPALRVSVEQLDADVDDFLRSGLEEGPISANQSPEAESGSLDESEVEFWLRAFGSDSGDATR